MTSCIALQSLHLTAEFRFFGAQSAETGLLLWFERCEPSLYFTSLHTLPIRPILVFLTEVLLASVQLLLPSAQLLDHILDFRDVLFEVLSVYV
jgi:hypothetical protein